MVSEQQQQQQQQQRFLFFQVFFFFESRFKNLTARCLGCKKGKKVCLLEKYSFFGGSKHLNREGIFFAPRLSNGWMDPVMRQKKARSKKGRRRFDVFL